MDIDDRNNTNSLSTQTSMGLNMSFLIVGIRVHARSELEFSMLTVTEKRTWPRDGPQLHDV